MLYVMLYLDMYIPLNVDSHFFLFLITFQLAHTPWISAPISFTKLNYSIDSYPLLGSVF